MKKKIALFDLDGTLYDTRKINYLAYQKALEPFGKAVDYMFFASHCYGRHYGDFLPDIMDSVEHVEEVHRLKKRFYHDFLAKAVENKHLFQMIQCMKPEYYIALVTTASRENCEELLKYHNRLGEFDLIIAQEDVKKKKPNPEGYLKAMEYYQISKEDAIIFEDSDAGIEAAKKSGATLFIAKGFS